MNDRMFALVLVAFALAMTTADVTLAADSQGVSLTAQSRQMDSLATSQGEGAVSGRISSDFSAFAGSTANVDALVSGLRNGTSITLTSTDAKGVTTSTTFTPPTGKMGYGNVYTSLALAKQNLAAVGITEPTAQQLQAALVGGSVTNSSGQTTSMTGVLELRAQGMGWGEIAHSYGYKLGPVISGMKSSNAKIAADARSGTAAAATSASSSKSGIVSGAGSTGGGHGQGHAYGRGIVTGAGAPAGGSGQGNAYGKGIVTGGGAAAGSAAAAAQGKGHGKGN